MSVVSIVPCQDYAPDTVRPALEAVLRPLGGLTWVQSGMTIAIKANLVSMMKPESAATTHPSLLTALCELLAARGARGVVGDSPGGLYTPAYVNAVYAATGMRAVLETGAKLNQNFAHAHAENPDGFVLKSLDYTAYLDEADAIIDFCKLKTHGMMGMSACVKNMFGVIPGTFKPEYHYRFPAHADFADMLVDLNERFRPRLCLVDAVVGMEGNGPTMGHPRAIGALIASDSPYAADRVCAGIIGLDPAQTETIQRAAARGLEDELRLFGDPSAFAIPDFDLVRTRKELAFTHELPGLWGTLFGKLVSTALCSRPAVERRACVGCEKCKNLCPAKAISMRNRRPIIDRARCIRCFCCQEFCPKGAMRVKRPPIARILNRRKDESAK